MHGYVLCFIRFQQSNEFSEMKKARRTAASEEAAVMLSIDQFCQDILFRPMVNAVIRATHGTGSLAFRNLLMLLLL